MHSKFIDVEQNTDEWFNLRVGRVTASRFKSLFSAKSTASWKGLIADCAFENVLCRSVSNSFKSNWMERGNELEEQAVSAYENEHLFMEKTLNGGFYEFGEFFGSSPDRRIGDNGILEAKNPCAHVYVKYLSKAKLPSEYQEQVHGQLLTADKEYCDFISHYPGLKPLVVRVERDIKWDSRLIEAMEEAEEEILKTINILKEGE